MAKYRAAVVGCGWVSGEHIAAYKNNPLTEVAALVSLTEEEARRKAEECKLKVPCYDSIEKMMQQEEPDIVSITSIPTMHVEHGLCAVEHGAQLVMEKPVALSRDDLRRLTQSVKQHGTKSVVSFVLRWNPLFSVIRALLDDGAVGELFYGEVDYYHGIGPWYKQYEWNKTKAAGGNTLLSAGCHALDALVWFMGSPVTEVYSCAARSKADIYMAYEYAPTLVTLFQFQNGLCGKVTSCIEVKAPYMFPILLLGSEGTIRNNQLYSSKKLPGQTHFATIPTILPDSGDVTHHPFQGEIDHFVDCLERGVDSSVPIESAAKIMELCYAAEESALTGRSVKIEG
ncbi:MAG: Gfo/Idh/MocA family protein [bacterium]